MNHEFKVLKSRAASFLFDRTLGGSQSYLLT